MCKNPAFAAVVALTLALGVGANSAVFSVARAVFAPLPVPQADRVVFVWTENQVGNFHERQRPRDQKICGAVRVFVSQKHITGHETRLSRSRRPLEARGRIMRMRLIAPIVLTLSAGVLPARAQFVNPDVPVGISQQNPGQVFVGSVRLGLSFAQSDESPCGAAGLSPGADSPHILGQGYEPCCNGEQLLPRALSISCALAHTGRRR